MDPNNSAIDKTPVPWSTKNDNAKKSVSFALNSDLKFTGNLARQVTLNSIQYDSSYKANPSNIALTKTNSQHTIQTSLGHGLLGTVFEAYNNHCHLVLSPDDIWICVMNSLSIYVDKHAEEMRSIFVNHKGKEHLIVYVPPATIKTINYESAVAKMMMEMSKHLTIDILEWSQCDFTTSTEHSRFISQVQLMGSMKSYFTYEIVTMCGLTGATLLGTVDDWAKLRAKILHLKSFNQEVLAKWVDVMIHVLDQMTLAFYNKVDSEFWNFIVSKEEPRGSGSSSIHGWIIAFCGFSASGRYILKDLETIKSKNDYGCVSAANLPSGLTGVPVRIDTSLVDGHIYETTFHAGSLLTNVVKESRSCKLTPSQDFAIVIDKILQ